MKNKTAFQFLILTVILLTQISALSAQKGGARTTCADNPPTASCIEIEPENYNGFYQIIDPNDPETKKKFYIKNEKINLKINYPYVLRIAGDETDLLFTVKDDGRILTKNAVALDTAAVKKIKFNTVPIFIEPGNYNLEYFLLIYSGPLFKGGKDNYCPFSNKPVDDANAVNCPRKRDSKLPIYLVPTLTYTVEPYAIGYTDNQISFQVDKSGNVSNLNKPFAADVTKNKITFRNSNVKFTSVDYTGYVKFGSKSVYIKAKESEPITIIPYLPVLIGVLNLDNNQSLITTTFRVIPQEMVLKVPSGKQPFAKFTFQKLE